MDRLFSPWLMRAAWNKTQSWYRSGEPYDPAEYLAWQADPWAHLAELAHELSTGKYRPRPFPTIPYPKKGDTIRHYVVPTVRDQVAFMALLTLLGPFLEGRMYNVSFGNRLYRPRVLMAEGTDGIASGDGSDDDSSRAVTAGLRRRWYRAPFSLNQVRVYDSFSTGYGLFRRLSQWIVNRSILGDKVHEELQWDTPEEEDPDVLPYLEELKNQPSADLAYARLDLSLAYPSVDRVALGRYLQEIVKDDYVSPTERDWGRPSFPELRVHRDGHPFRYTIEESRKLAGPHPWHILVWNEDLRLQVCQLLVQSLSAVEYAPWKEPEEWEVVSREVDFFPVRWQRELKRRLTLAAESHARRESGKEHRPPDVAPWEKMLDPRGFWSMTCSIPEDLLRSNRFGLPTGLAASGVLLNVALNPIDEVMCQQYEKACSQGAPPVIYLRFADDMLMFSKSERALEQALRRLTSLLAGEHPHLSAHLRLNIEKAEPDSVKEFLERLNHSGDGDEARLRLKNSEWYTRGRVELFTTPVVRQMSALVDETLEDKFGAAGMERLEQLIHLAEVGDGDLELADDARLSFSVNRMAKASWPDRPVRQDGGSGLVVGHESYIRRVLTVAENTLRQHPWRFKLWRAISIIAFRSSVGNSNVGGMSWLRDHILPLIRWASPATDEAQSAQTRSTLSWEIYDPEGGLGDNDESGQQQRSLSEADARLLGVVTDFPVKIAERRGHHRRLRTSFHRAWFWRQWAGCVRDLRSALKEGPTGNNSRRWTNLLTKQEIQELLDKFGSPEGFRRLCDILYGSVEPTYWPKSGPFMWWWEAEALADAMLAVARPDVKLLRSLGNPRPGRLRELDWILKHEVAEQLLPGTGGLWEDLRAALENVYGFAGMKHRGKSSPGTPQRRALLWTTKAAFSSNSTQGGSVLESLVGRGEAARSLMPQRGDDTLDWAALARMGFWEDVPGLVRRMGRTFSAPSLATLPVPKSQAKLWRGVIALDAYHFLRRLRQAYGQVVLLKDFPGWFPGIIPQPSKEAPSSMQRTLLQAMFALPNARPVRTKTKSTALPDAEVPALESPAAAGRFLLDIPKPKDYATCIVFPDAVVVEASVNGDAAKGDADFLAELNAFRRALLVRDDRSEGDTEAATVVLGAEWNAVSHAFRRLSEAAARLSKQQVQILPLHGEMRAPHALYILPELLRTECETLAEDAFMHETLQQAHEWRTALLYLWLVSGSEAILNSLYRSAPWQPSLFDRDIIRSQLMLDEETWARVEKALGTQGASIRLVKMRHEAKSKPVDATQAGASNQQDAERMLRIDFSSVDGGDWTVQPGTLVKPLDVESNLESLRVRLIQAKERPEFHRLPVLEAGFIIWRRDTIQNVAEELVHRLQEARVQSRYGSDPPLPERLIIFPEWYVPENYIMDLHRFVHETGIGVLAGVLPRELPRAVPAIASLQTTGWRAIVNEAVLILPGQPGPDEKMLQAFLQRDRKGRVRAGSVSVGPSRVFEFRIRKPYASFLELGLIEHLNERAKAGGLPSARWVSVPGVTWYLFSYYDWGNFSVAICSDVLDTFVWDWLRGRIQHLFIVAWNQDIDLFDQVTWTRGYELYANAVTVNHGENGGSVVWTPKHGHEKEIFRVRGAKKGLAVTVDLPVRSLIEAQKNRWKSSIKGASWKWQQILDPKQRRSKPDDKYKSPPSNYPRLASH